MMEQCCENICDELCKTFKSYTQAVKNLKDDCCPDNGNIPQTVVASINRCCEQRGNDYKGILSIVKQHGVLEKPEFYATVSFADCNSADGKLRRLVPIRDFVIHHIGVSDDSAAARKENDLESRIQRYKTMLQIEWNSDDLNGWTGDPETVSWWTFNLIGSTPIPDALEYVNQLAIQWSEQTQKDLGKDQMIVEIIIDAGQVGELYKPTALESFQENTLFRPGAKDIPYGMTCPRCLSESSTRVDPLGRPELISRSICYQKQKNVTVTTQYWSY
jgi:hypothetical protein